MGLLGVGFRMQGRINDSRKIGSGVGLHDNHIENWKVSQWVCCPGV